MQFSDSTTARIYSDRTVTSSWLAWCQEQIDPAGKTVVDIGCGGGIYSQGFVQCGARAVTGVDFSEQYILSAREEFPLIRFVHAPCEATTLVNDSADIVYERALIHHLTASQKHQNAREMFRILCSGGMAVIQNRTLDNVQAQDDAFYIRRELITMFPRLIEFEKQRRPRSADYTQTLKEAGFSRIESHSVAEVRRVYETIEDLDRELSARKGKSILFQLSDAELKRYRERIRELSAETNIIERDQWHIWFAHKPA